jgi:hypothetical protein
VTPGGSSFTAGTLVLLASGKAVPISQLKVGEMVLATNTKTGKTQPEAVTAVLVHHDTDLYDLKSGLVPRLLSSTRPAPICSGYRAPWVAAGGPRRVLSSTAPTCPLQTARTPRSSPAAGYRASPLAGCGTSPSPATTTTTSTSTPPPQTSSSTTATSPACRICMATSHHRRMRGLLLFETLV